ncbi:hypothetical protein [Sphingomonas sp.]|uniref:hypothetical protein n=1 Tax=Sphingomonas sp. TaxID=28214 RepID=UPI00286D450D|nr:hypothetical protein [Sphingomonas sp.]
MLVQPTGDADWVHGRFVPSRSRGLEENDDGGLSPEVQAEVRQAAAVELCKWFAGSPSVLPEPLGKLLREMMSVSLSEEVTAGYVPMIRRELGLVGKSAVEDAPAAPPGFTALIIGAGIYELCAAIELAKTGIPYTIVERSNELGRLATEWATRPTNSI